MIQARNEIKGVVTSRSEIVGKVVIQTKEIEPATQEKVVKPSLDVQEVTPDSEYTGLSKVTVEAVKLQNKTVSPTSEEQTITSDDDFIGLNEVKVNAIPSEYVKPTGTLDISANGEYDVKSYEKANVNVGSFEITNAAYLFTRGHRHDTIDELLALLSPNCQNFDNMFASSPSSFKEIKSFNTSNGTILSRIFAYCYSLETVGMLDLSSATNISGMFDYDSKLTNLGGFKDLGKAYLTTSSANYSNYKLDLSVSNNITYDSLMNVINNLYDIASKGCKTQSLVLGATNLAKLEATEEGQQAIAICQTKGWTIS